jgi:hypothetical protein
MRETQSWDEGMAGSALARGLKAELSTLAEPELSILARHIHVGEDQQLATCDSMAETGSQNGNPG